MLQCHFPEVSFVFIGVQILNNTRIVP